MQRMLYRETQLTRVEVQEGVNDLIMLLILPKISFILFQLIFVGKFTFYFL